jgi:hypothetical protein
VRRAVGPVRRDGVERAHLLPALERLRSHGAVLCALRAAELTPSGWIPSTSSAELTPSGWIRSTSSNEIQ